MLRPPILFTAAPILVLAFASGCNGGGGGPTTASSDAGTHASTTTTETTTAPTVDDTSDSTSDSTTAEPTTGTPTKVDKRVFVTAARFHGDLMHQGGGADGVDGADKLCQAAASQAQLGGAWVAWVSSSSVDAITRLADDGRWALVDGTEVFAARSEIQLGPKHAIDRTESGEALLPSQDPVVVWTNTDSLGRNSQDGQNDACDDWSGQVGAAAVGVLFDPQSGGGPGLHWTDTKQPRGCGDTFHLYCFEP